MLCKYVQHEGERDKEFCGHYRKRKKSGEEQWTHARFLIRPPKFCSNFFQGSSPYAARYHSSSCRRSFQASITSSDSARSSASCSAVSRVTGFCCPKALWQPGQVCGASWAAQGMFEVDDCGWLACESMGSWSYWRHFKKMVQTINTEEDIFPWGTWKYPEGAPSLHQTLMFFFDIFWWSYLGSFQERLLCGFSKGAATKCNKELDLSL